MGERIIMSPEEAADWLRQGARLREAQIFDASTQKPFTVQELTLDLTTAKLETAPMKIGFAFKGVWVQTATDTSTSIRIKIGTQDSVQSSFSMKNNDTFQIDQMTSEAYLFWSAQSGKSITLIFFTDAQFRPGSIISQNSGSITQSDGTSVAIGAQVTLTAATAAVIAPALGTRKVATIQNKTGADLYIGDSTVTSSGANEGIKIPADGLISWRNTAALYGISVAGGVVSRIEEA